MHSSLQQHSKLRRPLPTLLIEHWQQLKKYQLLEVTLRLVLRRRRGLGKVCMCHQELMRLRVSAPMPYSLVSLPEPRGQMAQPLQRTEVLRLVLMQFRLRVL